MPIALQQLMKPKVLFVDDEPLVLSGLQRALRSLQGECETLFAVGPHRALDHLRKEPFEVIISDMRMPEIDGATLLEKYRQETPDTVRIILSGQANAESVVKSFAVTHQYMSKPANVEYLTELLRSLFATSQILKNPIVRRKVSQLSALPIRQSTYLALQQMSSSGEINYPELERLARVDAGLIARLIHIAGLTPETRQQILSISDLVSASNTEILSRAMRLTSLFSPIPDASPLGILLREIAEHQVMIGESLVESTPHLPVKERFNLFFSALLHDFGKIILIHLFPEIHKESFNTAVSLSSNYSTAEEKTFGASHAEVGAYLATIWGLPQEIAQAIALHSSKIDEGNSLAYQLKNAHRIAPLSSRMTEESYGQ